MKTVTPIEDLFKELFLFTKPESVPTTDTIHSVYPTRMLAGMLVKHIKNKSQVRGISDEWTIDVHTSFLGKYLPAAFEDHVEPERFYTRRYLIDLMANNQIGSMYNDVIRPTRLHVHFTRQNPIDGDINLALVIIDLDVITSILQKIAFPVGGDRFWMLYKPFYAQGELPAVLEEAMNAKYPLYLIDYA